MRSFPFTTSVLLAGFALSAGATDVPANPTNYLSLLSTLKPGDTLQLTAGTYTNQLPISGLNGTPCAWITISGPSSGPGAVFTPNACANTVEIKNSSYLAIENLTLDGQGLSGPFGVSANGGTGNLVHDILIEGCTIQNFNGSQQTDGISTKTPTWGWIIRRNQILNAGTGLYLGNSDGSDPFVKGLIEDNFVVDPIGYCMEIKYQAPWPTVAGMPTEPSSTIIRNNVFIKNDQPSPDGTRPNLLVGGFPDGGPGSQNLYEVYGNLFVHNVAQPLFQFSGRVAVHDNLFIDSAFEGIAAQDQDLPLELAYVYDNTFYVVGTGIAFAQAPPEGDGVVGNVVFAGTPITGPISDLRDNITVPLGDAGVFVADPTITLAQANFYPRVGQCQGPAIDMSKFAANLDYDLDFNGVPREPFTFRGAYAGQGVNPGWQLAAGVKPVAFLDTGACWNASGDAGFGTEGVDDGVIGDGGNVSADAGQSTPDGGPVLTDGGAPMGSLDAGVTKATSGCGCNSAGLEPLAWMALLVAPTRRKRSKPS
jgi:hypothetical protein